ncbi:MAG: DPP IV N-terminal domain-containing protein [Planctomycetota bacterium]
MHASHTALATLSALALVLASGCSSTGTTTDFSQVDSNTDTDPSLDVGLDGWMEADVYAAGNGFPQGAATQNFGVFGDLPSTGAHASQPAMTHDATSNLRRVSYAEVGADFDPTFSPKGETLFFSSTRHRPTSDIYAQSTTGRSVTQLTTDPAHDVMPAVSPDGKRVAFASNRTGDWNIYVMNSAGGQAIQITDNSEHELHPSWSPDGSHIVYSRLNQRSERWEIWTVSVDRPAVQTFVTFGLFPEWHPVEDVVLFQRSRERGDRYFGVWTIKLVDGQGVEPTEIFSSPSMAAINPAWSPDGEFIACATVQHPVAGPFAQTKPDYADVWVIRRDGGVRTNLTNGYHVNLMPAWAPDNSIFFISDRGGFDNVWSVDPTQAMVAAGMDIEGSAPFANVPFEDE